MARGHDKAVVYERHIEPFIEEKLKELFGAFCNVSITDTDALVNIRMQAQALQGLSNEFTQVIDTGRLAAKQLETLENENQ